MSRPRIEELDLESTAESDADEAMTFADPESVPTAAQQQELEAFLREFHDEASVFELLDMHAVVDIKAES